jgi:cell division protein FtsZ
VEGLSGAIATIAIAVLSVLLVMRLVVGRVSVGRPSLRLPRLPRIGRVGRSAGRARPIVAVGVGGGGSNAIDAMVRANLNGVELVACNTDAQALRRSRARTKVQLGRAITGGLGAGGDPAVGRRAAEEDAEGIARIVGGAALVFVTAGLGGGTGSGGAPIVAEIARQHGALTIGVFTLPFGFEGDRRAEIAAKAATELRSAVDTLLTIPNDRLHAVAPETASLIDAFGVADGILRLAVGTIIDVIAVPGLINLDFADLRSVLADGGPAVFGVGRATGDDRALDATREALASPLLEPGIAGAQSVLFHVAGPANLRLAEVRGAADEIRAASDSGVNVVFGATVNRRLRDEVLVTVIGTRLRGASGDETRAVASPTQASLVREPPVGGGSKPRRASTG